MKSRRTVVLLPVAAVLLLTACGGSNVTLPTAKPTISIPSITGTPSLPTLPTRTATATDQPTTAPPTSESPTSASPTTASPSRTASATTTPTRSDSPTPTPTTPKPTSASPTSASPTSASPTSASPTSASPTSDSPTPTPTSASPTSMSPTSASASPAPEPSSGSLPWWLWALLAAAIVGGAAWWLAVGAKRRKWDAAFATTLAEIRWATDVLAPSVVNRALPADQVAAQWTDSKRRLDDLQASLYRMQSDIPTPDRAQRLGVVTGALTAMTAALEHDVAIRTGGYALTEPDLLASAQSVEHARTTLAAAVSGTPTAPGAHRS